MAWALVVASTLLLAAPAAHSVKIQYEALDLADEITGEDLWQYTYRLDEFPFAANFGFSVLFDPARYRGLESPPPAVGPDWDVLSIPPDPLLADDGRYDAQALTASPSVAEPFSVTFIFLGTGTPGPQAFEVFEPSFSTVQTGFTVPEPSSRILLLSGVCILSIVARLASVRAGASSRWVRGAS